MPTVWNANINVALKKDMVFAEDCNREYEGDVRKAGDAVRILGVGKPTITTQSNTKIVLGAPEEVEDISTTLPIRQVAYFNFKVDDIDKRQAEGKVLEALRSEASLGLSDVMDQYIANLAAGGVFDSATSYQLTKSNILEKVDAALVRLYENNVSRNARITMTLPPWVYMLLKQAYTDLDTDNSEMLKNGRVGRYGSVVVKLSNNVAKSGGDFLIQVKTDKAIAFVNPLIHTEAYRPEDGFADAIKGFVLYDAKIVRADEMIVMNVKK